MHLSHVVALPLLLTGRPACMAPVGLLLRCQAITTHPVVRQQPAVPPGGPATPPSTPTSSEPCRMATAISGPASCNAWPERRTRVAQSTALRRVELIRTRSGSRRTMQR
jgi:hypothetical protein